MVKRVVWTQTAIRHYREIIFYYRNNDAIQAAYKFEDAVFKRIERLIEQPLIGRPTKKYKTVRSINVDKHRQMTYRVVGKTLFNKFLGYKTRPLTASVSTPQYFKQKNQ